MKRRDFIKLSSAASLSSVFLPNRLGAAFSPLMLQSCTGINERVLVLVRLIGGNDGINTLVPIDQYNSYANLRPTIRVPDTGTDAYINLDNTLPVQDQVGLHPLLGPFKNMYDNGELTVIQGVQYDNQDRSHFKSTDLWMTGGDGTASNNNLGSGWIARYLENSFPGAAGNPNLFSSPLALQLAEKKPAILFDGDHSHGISTNLSGQDLAGYYSVVSGIGGAPIGTVPGTDHGDMLQYIMDVEKNANVYSQVISDAFNNGSNALTYPVFDLADQLKTVSRLVSGGLQTKVFLVSLGGFDTHNDQIDPTLGVSVGRHAALLAELSQSIKAFMDDIKALGIADKFLTATFSEFGRKVQENGNFGTDHGGTAPMFVIGSGLNGGIIGTNDDLSEATSANNYQIETKQYDYRNVFATLLQDWLGAATSIVDFSLYDNNNLTTSYTGSKLNTLINDNYKVESNCYIVNFLVNVDKISGNNQIVLYPVPAKNHINIDFGHNFSGTISLCNTSGKTIIQKTLTNSSSSSLRFRKLPPGTYFVQIVAANNEIVTREITVL